MTLSGTMLRSHAERNAKGKTYKELIQRLQENEARVMARLMNAGDVELNRARARHVIGIEGWGTHRMRTLLGEPLVLDEYDGYAPSPELNMMQLATVFKQTRAATIALLQELQSNGIDLSQTAKHNELGDLSAGGWVVYMSSHSSRETLFMFPRLHNEANKTVKS